MEATENGDFTTGDGTVLHVEIIPSDGSWSGAPDTTAATFDGWATDKSGDGSFIEIKTYGTARSSTGNWDTVAYILQVTSTSAPSIFLDNDANASNFLDITFEGVQMQHIDGAEANGQSNVYIQNVAYHNEIEFEKCFFKADAANGDINFLNVDAAANVDILIRNCIAQYGLAGIRPLNLDASAVFKVYNCTVMQCTNGIDTDSEATATIKNCAIFNTTTADFPETANSTFNYNACDDGEGTSNEVAMGNNATEWAKAFTNYESDWNVKDASSVLYQAGLDQSSDALIPSDDIAGNARADGSESIGAFEFVAAAADVTPILRRPIDNYIRNLITR